MTVKICMDQLSALALKHIEQIEAGEITEAQANSETEEFMLRARLEMTDEELGEVVRCWLAIHQTAAGHLSETGRPIPGNDPRKPN